MYRMDLMRTSPSIAKSLSSVLTSLVLLGASTTASAQVEPTKPVAATAEPASAASLEPPQAEPTATVAVAPSEASQAAAMAQPAPDPASITEVGIQRLPGSAFPEPVTRGLPYGSLALTFHGMQWPYMPAVGPGSRFVIGLSGWGWIDTSYEKFRPWSTSRKPPTGLMSKDKIRYWIQQSRLLLRITPTYSLGDGWFVQGQAELVGTGDQTIGRQIQGGADTDDLFIRVGQWNKWDFQVGRFEGWEVFHLGMGLDYLTFERNGAVGVGENANPISFYGLTDNQFRPEGAAGNFAAHYYPLPYLRFELLGTAGTAGTNPMYATRPVAILDFGWLKFKLGTEYQRRLGQAMTDQTQKTSKGVGGAIQFVFLPHLEFGLNAAQGTVWSIDAKNKWDKQGSFTRTSFGGFLNLSNGSRKHPLIFGLGSMYSIKEDQNDAEGNGIVDRYWLMQNYVAVQYVLKQQLYIKLVGGYSRGHWRLAGAPPLTEWDDEMYSVRVRFAFYF
jgi:hypothetical protein